MKPRYLNLLIFLFLAIHHSSEQGLSFIPILNNVSNNNMPTNNGGLVDTLRNTTSNLFRRLEGPRDRVVELIKPVVKSDFSRNVTNVLNTIWNRVQESNSTIIQHPFVKNSIVIPINTTLERLKQVTALNDESSEINQSNFEYINHSEDESSRDSVQAEPSNHETIFLIFTDNLANLSNVGINSNESKEINLGEVAFISNPDLIVDSNQDFKASDLDSQTVNEKLIHSETSKQIQSSKDVSESEIRKEDRKSDKKRKARFFDNFIGATPNNIRFLFNNLQRNGMRECFALALCESHCRPHLYSSNGGGFKHLFDRVESFNLEHEDFEYYLGARKFGQEYNSDFNECNMCHQRYFCPHEREYLINQFSRMSNFN